MKQLGKIDILGVNYKLYLYENEFKKLQDDAEERDSRYFYPKRDHKIDGYCDYVSKEIRVYRDELTDENYFNTTLRHEICHAFLYEIGCPQHDNEDFVDQLSKWIPYINKIFKNAMCVIEVKELIREE